VHFTELRYQDPATRTYLGSPSIVRTAYDGAHNRHDSNRITFHRLADFRRPIG